MVRGWYVRAFVQAVRGRERAAGTAVSGIILLGVALLLVSVVTAGEVYVQTEMVRVREMLRRAEQYSAPYLESSENPGTMPDTTVSTGSETLRGDVDSLTAEVTRTLDTISELEGDLAALSRGNRLAIALLLIASVVVGGLWLPFATFRSRFAFELERFSMRIQGLASKGELATLAATEAAVHDEQSLRAFVGVMQRIAERHGIEPLISTFNLWGRDTEPEGSSDG
jgi:hypothetical protein